jgi:hypothetical protein
MASARGYLKKNIEYWISLFIYFIGSYIHFYGKINVYFINIYK